MSPPYPTLVIDTVSPLGERVRSLLAQAGIRGLHSADTHAVQAGDRLLLVDASPAQLRKAHKAGPQHVVHVQQASAFVGGLHEAVGHARLSWLSTQLYFDALLPRIALALHTGRFLSAMPARRAAYIAHEDAAIAAAALLASDVQTARTLHLTGPTALSHADVCALLAEQFGRSIDLEQVTLDSLQAELVRRGLGSAEARISAELDLALTRELPDVSHDSAKITGMAPLSAAAILTRVREPLLRAAAELPTSRRTAAASLPAESSGLLRIWSCSAQA